MLSSKKKHFQHLSALLVMSDENYSHYNKEEQREMGLEGNTAFRK